VGALPTTKPERLGITMLINDKSRLKRNVEQIGDQLMLKTSKSLSWSDRLRQTVPCCRTGNREGIVSKHRLIEARLTSLDTYLNTCTLNRLRRLMYSPTIFLLSPFLDFINSATSAGCWDMKRWSIRYRMPISGLLANIRTQKRSRKRVYFL